MPLDVGPHLLQFAERLPAALIFEHLVRQLKRMAQSIGIDLRPQSLCDGIDIIILKILRHAGDKGSSHRRQEEKRTAETGC